MRYQVNKVAIFKNLYVSARQDVVFKFRTVIIKSQIFYIEKLCTLFSDFA